MNTYLLTFDQATASRRTVVAQIDRIREISNWMFFFDNAVCLISDESVERLTDLLRERLPETHFLVVKLEQSKRGGWLRQSIWDFIRSPKPVNS